MATSFFNNNCEDEVEELESAKQYADLSRDWAIKMDGLVDGIDFSSKYWAMQSAEGAGLSVTIKEDGTPLGDSFTVLNFGAGVSATQTTTNEVLIQSTGQVLVETFDDGVGFIAGTSDEITLATEVVSKNNIDIYFDGIYQNKETYDVSGVLVTFTSVIPVGVGEIEVVYPRLMDVGVTSADNVMFDGSTVDAELVSLDGRLTTAESDIVSLDGRLTIVERSTLVNRPFPNVAAVDTATFLQTGDFVEWLGYTTPGDGGGNKGEIGTGFGTADNGSIFDLSGSGLQARGLFPNGVNIAQFGASPSSPSTVNTAAIQNSWDYAASIGRKVSGAPGIFTIARSGNQISARDYGLLIPDGLKFDGGNKTVFTIRADDNSDMDVITTQRLVPSSGIEFVNVTVDGNSPNQTIIGPNQSAGGMNLWIHDADDVTLSDVTSIDSSAFGFRLTKVTNMQMHNLRCDHAPDINADGVHLKDCSDVVGSNIIIKTEGDDGFIINAENSDVHDVAIAGIVVHAPVLVAAGRGVYISNAESNVDAGIQRKLYNINLTGVVTYNCDATAVLLAFGDFYNVHVDFVDYGSVVGLGFIIGSTSGVGVTGSVKNCSFKCSLWDSQTNAITLTNSDGLMSYTEIDATINNPGDGSVGAILSGEHCCFKIRMDYDPDGSKATPLQGVRHAPATTFLGNDVYLTVNGANTGLELNSGAEQNNIYIGSITNSVTADIDFNSGANNNTIIGGSLESFENAGTGNKVSATRGATNYGRITLSPDGSGTDVIPHGLIASPDYFQAAVFSGSQVIATVSARDSTNLTITFRDYSGTLVTTGSHQVTWEASIF